MRGTQGSSTKAVWDKTPLPQDKAPGRFKADKAQLPYCTVDAGGRMWGCRLRTKRASCLPVERVTSDIYHILPDLT